MKSFQSKRLEYSKFVEEEYALYHALSSNEKVMQYIRGRPLTASETLQRFKKILALNKKYVRPGVFAVRSLDTKDFVGLAKATVFAKGEIEIGYALMPAYWGNGLGSEISDAMVAYSRDIRNAKALVGIIDPANLASKRILEKSGLSFFEEVVIEELPGALFKMVL